jgi:hypothetical protein
MILQKQIIPGNMWRNKMKKIIILFSFFLILLAGCNKKSNPAGTLDATTPTPTPNFTYIINVIDNLTPVENLSIKLINLSDNTYKLATTNSSGNATYNINYSGNYQINIAAQDHYNDLSYNVTINSNGTYFIDRGTQLLELSLDEGCTKDWDINSKTAVYTIIYRTGANKTYTLSAEGISSTIYSFSKPSLSVNGETAKFYINIPESYEVLPKKITFTVKGTNAPADTINTTTETFNQLWNFDMVLATFWFKKSWHDTLCAYFTENSNIIIAEMVFGTSNITGFSPSGALQITYDDISLISGGTEYILPLPSIQMPIRTEINRTDETMLFDLAVLGGITSGCANSIFMNNISGVNITLNITDGGKLHVKRKYTLSGGIGSSFSLKSNNITGVIE